MGKLLIKRESLLRKIASKSDHKQYNHSALLFKGSALISQGYNHGIKHAEVSAINKIKHKVDLNGTVLVSFRVSRISSSIGNSRPCDSCRRFLHFKGVRKIVYFEAGEWIEEELNILTV